LRLLHARIHKRDGRVIEGEPSGDTLVADAGIAMYYDLRARHVRFGGAESGDVVELDYRLAPVSPKGAYGDYFGELLLMRDEFPQVLKRVVLLAPAEAALNVAEVRMPQPAVKRVRDGTQEWLWELHDVAAAPREPRAPALAELSPYIHVSTFGSWSALGRWYAELIAPQFALDAALRDALAPLLAKQKTPLEKIAAIHEFVLSNTHYVALEFGVYSYKPYPVAQVYARRYGDCKDKASLMISLLRAAGIPAELALVRTRRLGVIDAGTPSLALFNHAVAYVPAYDLWLDGTAEYAGRRELPLDDQGALALTVSAAGDARLRRIPESSALDNYSHRTVTARVQDDGAVHFFGRSVTRGEDAPGLRRGYEVAERQLDFFRNRLAEVLPSVKVDAVHVDGAHELDRAVSVDFRGVLSARRSARTLALTSSWLPQRYLQELAPLTTRSEDLLLPAPWTAEEEIRFVLPANAELGRVPRPTHIETPFGLASVTYQRRGSELAVRTFVQFRTVRITPRDYPAFRAFCAALERAFRDEIRIRLEG
jgi:transglutaminase-like putative cysteine protease